MAIYATLIPVFSWLVYYVLKFLPSKPSISEPLPYASNLCVQSGFWYSIVKESDTPHNNIPCFRSKPLRVIILKWPNQLHLVIILLILYTIWIYFHRLSTSLCHFNGIFRKPTYIFLSLSLNNPIIYTTVHLMPHTFICKCDYDMACTRNWSATVSPIYILSQRSGQGKYCCIIVVGRYSPLLGEFLLLVQE